MSTLIETADEIVANIMRLHEFGFGSDEQRKFHADRLRMGKRFVAYLDDDSAIFCPSKFAGYKDNGLDHAELLGERHGTTTSNRITKLIGNSLEYGDRGYKQIDRQFGVYCDSFGIAPTRWDRPRTFWTIRADQIGRKSAPQGFDRTYKEGAMTTVLSNRYERDRRARLACIDHHGCRCAVCDMKFSDFYGGLGEGYIHVHHLKPLSQIGQKYVVNPVKDLRPVCPNCHAMLHWGGREMLSIEDLRDKLRK